MRPHERSSASPTGTQPVFAENHRRPFSQTESSTRSSFVEIGGRRRPGCAANGGWETGVIGGDAISRTRTTAGGTPSTASRCTTRDAGSSRETTYSVDVGDSDCTGAKLDDSRSGPYVANAGVVEPASSCCLFTVQSSAPNGAEPA